MERDGADKQMEEEMLRKKKESQPISRRTLNSADHDKWEMNRMVTSGAVKYSDNSNSAMRDMALRMETEEDEKRVILMVHDVKPPFLDGRIVFTTQTEAIQVVRDPTSDFA
jgi:pre-mRNA-splicing factor ATP-dependent RNA helicase DHX38/PRP16